MSESSNARSGISEVVAEIILVAVAVAISIAVAAWLMGVYSGQGKPEVYVPVTVRLLSPASRQYQPVQGFVAIEAWSVPYESGNYKVYFRVTALKNLDYLRVKAEVLTRSGEHPRYAGGAVIEWENEDLPAGWYSEQYWAPILGDEYPITILVSVTFHEG